MNVHFMRMSCRLTAAGSGGMVVVAAFFPPLFFSFLHVPVFRQLALISACLIKGYGLSSLSVQCLCTSVECSSKIKLVNSGAASALTVAARSSESARLKGKLSC